MLPISKTMEIPSHLRIKLRPSTKYPDVVVGDFLLFIEPIAAVIGVEVRMKAETLGTDPMEVATRLGLHGLQDMLHDAMKALAGSDGNGKPAVNPQDTKEPDAPSDAEMVKTLTSDLMALQVKYDALVMHGLGIADV